MTPCESLQLRLIDASSPADIFNLRYDVGMSAAMQEIDQEEKIALLNLMNARMEEFLKE